LFAVAGIPEEPEDDRVPLVARDRERAQLLAALEEAGRGTGAAVLIQGDAGVGKSRLAEEIALEADQRGFRVLQARCSERGVATPFAPWVDLLRAGIEDTDPDTLRMALGDAGAEIARVLPELRSMFPDIPEPERLPSDQERRYILESVAEFIARGSATRPLVLVIDDVHWADEASIALLEETCPHVSNYPILFLATSRPPHQPLASFVARAVKDRDLSLIELDPLDETGVHALLDALTGQDAPDAVVGQMTTRTGGNPFYVTELVQHLREEGIGFDSDGAWLAEPDLAGAGVPDSIRLVLHARLDRVDDEVRRVLAGAAVVGRSAELKVAGRVVDSSPAELVDALDVAEKAGLVITEVDGAGRTLVTFAHDLIRDAVLDELTVARTQQLHLRVAHAVRDLHGMHPQSASTIAEHLVAAGAMADEEETCEACCAAGEAALEATAHQDALELFRRADELAPRGSLRKAQALRGLGAALRSTEGWEASLPLFMEALDLYVAIGDADAVGTLTTEIVIELAWAFKIPESFDVVERGMRALSELGRDDEDAWLLLASSRAALLTLLGVHDQALDALEEVAGRVEEMDGAPPDVVTLSMFQCAVMMGDLPRALDVYDREVERLRDTADRWTFCEFLGWAGFNLLSAGRIDDARAVTAELLPLAERLGHANALVLVNRALGGLALIDGDLQQAMWHAREDERICAEQGFPWIVQAWVFQAYHQLLAGDWDAADALARRALAADVMGAFGGTGPAMAALVRGFHNDAAGVLRLFREHLEPVLDDHLLWVGRHAMLNLMAFALALVGATDELARLRPVLLDDLSGRGDVSAWIILPQKLPAALAAAAVGEWEHAHADLAAARATASDLGMHGPFTSLDLWDAWLHLEQGGEALDSVPGLLDRAEQDFREAGMERHVELVARFRARLEELS